MSLEQIHAYGPELHSARAARQLVRSALVSLPSAAADDVLLVVSELVTNALVHARTELELHVRADPESVFVAVRDASAQPPRSQDTKLAVSGRGLRIVEALASRWGVDVQPGGKVVWCEVSIAAPVVVGGLDSSAGG